MVAEVMRRWGAKYLFTLSGGHLFPIYDGCTKVGGIEIVDTRHEQTAGFAAEGYAKLTRRPGFAALTAGPGVTNGVSAVTTASFNGSPLVVLGGRAPQARWGQGSLQEFDHVPLMHPITKVATTATSTADIAKVVSEVTREACTPHRGPAFVDFPLDVLFGRAKVELPEIAAGRGSRVGSGAAPEGEKRPTAGDTAEVAKLLASAERPVLVVGSDVYWDGAWERLHEFVEVAQVATFTNGMGRGCLPADHPLCFSRARSHALKHADLVVVAGTPLDFRLSFGRFPQARVVHLADHPDGLADHVPLAASAAGPLDGLFEEITSELRASSKSARGAGGLPAGRREWLEAVASEEKKRRESDVEHLRSQARPIRAGRIYGELTKRLDRDAIVICDGGDFVSFAGRYVDVYEPGCWMDPGPFGCLGTGPGYAIAAKLLYPQRQVVVLYGDGAFGFSGIDWDTMARFGLGVVGIVGNNGIWGLEKHPMRALYGYDVAADLQPQCRYDEMVSALGCEGELVTEPEEVGPALERAFESTKPYLVNVATDPDEVYPRSSNLA